MRAMKDQVTQRQMFALAGKFDPKVERIARIKEVVDASCISKIYRALMNDMPTRAAQYAVYHRDPAAQLGSEIVYVQNGVSYKLIIPDVPVKFGIREISLQKASGLGVYDSIELLKIEQTDEKIFTVSAVDTGALAGRVRAVNFMRSGWASPDEHGFPLVDQPVSQVDPEARCGGISAIPFEKEATGWHGSVGFYVAVTGKGRHVFAGYGWSEAMAVALVGHEAAPQV